MKDKKSMAIKRLKKRGKKEKERKIMKKEPGGKNPTISLPAEFGSDMGDLGSEEIKEFLLESPMLAETPQLQDFRFDHFLAIRHTGEITAKYQAELDTPEPSEDVVLKYYSEILERLFTRDARVDLKKRLRRYAQYQAKRGNEREAMTALVTEGALANKAVPLGAHPLLLHLYRLSVGENAQLWEPGEKSIEGVLPGVTGKSPVEVKPKETSKPSLFKRIAQAIKKARQGE